MCIKYLVICNNNAILIIMNYKKYFKNDIIIIHNIKASDLK